MGANSFPSPLQFLKLVEVNCRSGNHLAESYGFCHCIHHAPKTGLQFLSVGAVHHSYDIVILSGSHRIDPRNWSQPQARQHLILFFPASCGKDRDSIFILRLVHERECERSGAGSELNGDPRRETTRYSERRVDHPSSNLNRTVAMPSHDAQHSREPSLAQQQLRQTWGAFQGEGVNSHTADKTFTGVCQ